MATPIDYVANAKAVLGVLDAVDTSQSKFNMNAITQMAYAAAVKNLIGGSVTNLDQLEQELAGLEAALTPIATIIATLSASSSQNAQVQAKVDAATSKVSLLKNSLLNLAKQFAQPGTTATP